MNRLFWIWIITPLLLFSPNPSQAVVKYGTIWDDTITVNSDASGVKSYAGDDTITNNANIEASGSLTLNPAASTSKTAIDAGSGDDAIVSNGTVEADASATSSESASAYATAISAYKGNDTLTSHQGITAQATATVPERGNSIWDNLIGGILGDTLDLVHLANAEAKGFDGGEGIDTVIHHGPLTVGADATLSEPAMASSAKANATGISAENITTSGVNKVDSSATITYDAIIKTGTGIYGAEALAKTTALKGEGCESQISVTGDTSATASADITFDETAELNPLLSAALLGALSSAHSTTISSGAGDDTITTDAQITSNANASISANTAAAAGFVASALVVPISSANAKGIDSGEGNDTLTLSGSVDTQAAASNSSSGVSAVVAGLTVGETASLATAKATSVDTGGGCDTVSATAELTASSQASATNVKASLTGIGVDAALTGGVAATATSKTLDTGLGNDTVTSQGDMTSTATAATSANEFVVQGAGFAQLNASSSACATAKAADLGEGTDSLTTSGTLHTTATATGKGLRVDLTGIGGSVAGGTLLDSGTSASADASAITASVGDTTIENSGAILTGANANATSASIGATALGAAVTTESIFASGTRADAQSSGITTCTGADQITNTGLIQSTSSAEATSGSLSAALIGVAASTVTSEAKAESSAITTDGGQDTIDNSGDLATHASASATNAKITLAGIGAAAATGSLFKGGADASAEATAIHSGIDNDTLTNSGTISGSATAETLSVQVSGSLAGVSLASDSLFLGGSKAEAKATALNAGLGDDTVNNTGQITMVSDADATTVKFTATGLGAAITADSIFDTGTDAKATATGIDTGLGSDATTNEATISVTANADTASVSGAMALIGVATSSASSEAEATAKGITTGGGCDTLTNTAAIQANTNANSVGVQVGLTGIGATAATGGLFHGNTQADATSMGIDTGLDNDTIQNSGVISGNANATTASAQLTGSLVGVSLAANSLFSGGSKASAQFSGIDSGLGDDAITNTANMNASSDASATAVTLNVAGIGAAISADSIFDTGTSAKAKTVAMDGNLGNDTLANSGHLATSATSNTVEINAGMALIGVALSSASTKAEAGAIALDGGSGNDAITSTGTLDATADASANMVALNLTGIGAAAAVDSIFQGGTTAEASAKGMEGGLGADTVTNDGLINAKADASAVTAKINIAGLGVAFSGDSLFKAGTIADAKATGISTCLGADEITNRQTITAKADADTKTITAGMALVGLSATSAAAESNAQATGIDAGWDNDTVVNLATIEHTATAETTDVALQLVGVGVAAATDSVFNGGASSEATTTAIDGSCGDDTISNQAVLTGNAEADTTAVNLNLSLLGVSISALNTAKATATATGLAGGSGGDTLTTTADINQTADADATAVDLNLTLAGVSWSQENQTISEANALGMDGGCGSDTLTSDAEILATSTAHVTAASVSVNAAGLTGADASTQSIASSTGISGGSGCDTITNNQNLKAKATGTADTTAAAVNILGATQSNASALTQAVATGLDGGCLNDTLVNRAEITGEAIAEANSDGVVVELFGAANAEADSTAHAVSIGMDGGSGTDAMLSEDDITLTSYAHADSGSININLAGAADASAGTLALSEGTGMLGGDGCDTLANQSSISVVATADADASSGMVQLAGAGDLSADAKAQTMASGMTGGDGCDTLVNASLILSHSFSNAKAGAVIVELAGSSSGAADAIANAQAQGMQGDGGCDTLLNTGTLKAKAEAKANASNVNVLLAGASGASGNTEAQSLALGFTGATGCDEMENRATAEVSALSTLNMTGFGFTLAGTNNQDGTLGASAEGYGVDAGDDNDLFLNNGGLTVDATSHLNISNSSNSVAGTSGAALTTNSESRASGMKGGLGDDRLVNNTTLSVTGQSTASSNASSFSFAGVASQSGKLTAHAEAWGLEGDDGEDQLFNTGTATVTATTNFSIDSDSDVAFGASSGTSSIDTDTLATGMTGGDGTDRMENTGTFTIVSTAQTNSDQSSFSFAGTSGNNAVLNSVSDAVAFDAGAGADTIVNTGEVSVASTAFIHATGGSEVFLGGNSKSTGTVGTQASVTGIDAGDGGVQILNDTDASILLTATGDGLAENDSDGGLVFSNSGTTTSIFYDLEGFGANLGDGANTLINRGLLSLSLTTSDRSKADAEAEGGGILDNDAEAEAYANAVAHAIGIQAGDGNNAIENSGTLTVVTNPKAEARAYADGDGIDGDGDATAISSTTVSSRGLKIGDGDNLFINSGTLGVTASSSTIAWADADGDWGGSADTHTANDPEANAWAAEMGNGNNIIGNSGEISVTCTPSLSHSAGANTLLTFDKIPQAELANYAQNVASNSSTTAPVTASAVGFDLGDGQNSVENSGTLEVTSQPSVHSTASSNLNVSVFLPDDIDGDGEEDTQEVIDAYLDELKTAITASSSSATTSVMANAVGIRAGDGGNTIVNNGTLEVSSTPNVDNSATGQLTFTVSGNNVNWGTLNPLPYESVGGQVIGITCGAGDDTVVNNGTIRTIEHDNTHATAITTDGGADTVILGAASQTLGDILLGSGDDTLLFHDDASVGSSIDGGADTDTLVFSGVGSNNLTFDNFEALEKREAGTYTLAALPEISAITLTEGTLNTTAAFGLNASHTLTALLYGDGTCGAITSNAASTLGGAFTAQNGGGAYEDETLFTVMAAPAIAGSFASTELPEATPLLSFALSVNPESVTIEADVEPFESVAQTDQEKAIAQCMDAALPQAKGELDQALGAFQTLQADEYADAFEALSPSLYNQLALAALCQGEMHLEALVNQLSNPKAGYWAAGLNSDTTAASFGKSAQRFSGQGVTVGRTLGITQELSAGFSISHTTLHGDQSRFTTAQSQSNQWAGFTHLQKGATALTTAVLVGQFQNAANRDIAFSGFEKRGSSRYQSQIINTLVQTSHRFGDDEGYWQPMVRLGHTHLSEEGISESGLGTLGLSTGRRQLSLFETRVGFEMGRTASVSSGTLKSTLATAWTYTTGHKGLALSGTYGKKASAPVLLQEDEIKPAGLLFSSQIAFTSDTGTTVSLRGDGRLSRGDSIATVETELTIPF